MDKEKPSKDLAQYENEPWFVKAKEIAGCQTCREDQENVGPPHFASPYCESGGRNHCSCDFCF
jgi:hypothetical protein